MNNLKNPRFLTISGIILFAAISRIFPIAPNFQPILAIAIFAGYYLSDKKFSLLVPIVAMLLSDLFIQLVSPVFFGYQTPGFHSMMPFVYFSMILSVLIGSKLIKKLNVFNVIGSSFVSAVMFFLITNFGSWFAFEMYTKDLSGLMMSYEMGLPFFRNSLVSTLLYSGVLFGGFSLAEKYIKVLQPVTIK